MYSINDAHIPLQYHKIANVVLGSHCVERLETREHVCRKHELFSPEACSSFTVVGALTKQVFGTDLIRNPPIWLAENRYQVN